MIFFKQYLIMLTFIIIAVWVMPANTSSEELSTLCTALYEAGRLSDSYKDVSMEKFKEVMEKIKLNIGGRMREIAKITDQVKLVPFGQARKAMETEIKKKTDQAKEKAVGPNMNAVDNFLVNMSKYAEKKFQAMENKKKFQAMERLLGEIIGDIGDRVKLTRKKVNMDQIKKVLRNLTVEFTNFVRASVDPNEKKFCPLIEDFCSAKTGPNNYLEFFKSILNLNVEIQFN
ncbi:uncharacterized protein LOC100302481 precursor [Acyrthosiphon pisum]|uniref:Uncharacterized protein n=1 Tax=Acyrthosiphon pisum TaxID=7029 RepID=C4WSB8_ACYPI|nr:uncharacterized protein LOC100302481 precursor [Acyrthosiphon pisum]BAH70788.1 hypothetical protein [Acyrthosiphon pisum]|eukprot:NP_001156817.1 uncharacterized protein LOC100302481 precursor [Acyrthosiphon pisum]